LLKTYQLLPFLKRQSYLSYSKRSGAFLPLLLLLLLLLLAETLVVQLLKRRLSSMLS